MFELKPISGGAVPAALSKAERYRLLNEPAAAESICLDILQVEPEHQAALIMLLLARTDRFPQTMAGGVAAAREVLPRLADSYARAYYAGVVSERSARAIQEQGRRGSGPMVYHALRSAMESYEEAERLAPRDNDEARLRWNTCARILNASPNLAPLPEERFEPVLDD